MLISILLSIIAQIDPAKAIENISLNYGLLGSLYVITLSLLIGTILFIRKSFSTQIKDLNLRLDKSEIKAEEASKEFKNYLQDKNSLFVEVIKDYSATRDSSRVIMEKLLLKL
jgi:hypothetical protein